MKRLVMFLAALVGAKANAFETIDADALCNQRINFEKRKVVSLENLIGKLVVGKGRLFHRKKSGTLTVFFKMLKNKTLQS